MNIEAQSDDSTGLTTVINAAGTMTTLGASAASPSAIAAVADTLPVFVSMDEIQSQASTAIASATGLNRAVSLDVPLPGLLCRLLQR